MKLFLAPMQGMTNAYYRKLYHEIFGGVDAFYAPFIATTDIRRAGNALYKDIQPEPYNKSIPLVPQLLGCNGDDFRYFASKIVQLGYNEINWNIGCPSPTVTRKQKGSGILPYPELVRSVLDEVCKDTNYNLTVKMRLGLESPEEGPRIIEALNDYPLSGVMIHARTGIQKYEGIVDLDHFEVMASLCKHELTYNGDIYTYEDYQRIQARFPEIHNFMLGRGALRDPFLINSIKNGGSRPVDRNLILKDFHDKLYVHFGDKLKTDNLLLNVMKEFWVYLSYNLKNNEDILLSIRKITDKTAYEKKAAELFEQFEF